MIINLLMKQCRKSAMMAKQKQMVNTAVFISIWQGKPLRTHPACRFVAKTAGHIELRLTLPKLYFNSHIKFS